MPGKLCSTRREHNLHTHTHAHTHARKATSQDSCIHRQRRRPISGDRKLCGLLERASAAQHFIARCKMPRKTKCGTRSLVFCPHPDSELPFLRLCILHPDSPHQADKESDPIYLPLCILCAAARLNRSSKGNRAERAPSVALFREALHSAISAPSGIIIIVGSLRAELCTCSCPARVGHASHSSWRCTTRRPRRPRRAAV